MSVDRPKPKTLSVLNRLIWASILCVLSIGILGPLLFSIHADFPCMARYNPSQGCLSIRDPEFYYTEDSSEVEITATMEVFWSTRGAYVSGGGCFHEYSPDSQILVPTNLGEVRLESVHDTVLVGGHPVAPGDSLTRVRYWGWNPWVVSFLDVRNVGLVSDCPPDENPSQRPTTQRVTGERTVVLGDFGTRYSLGKGLIVLLALTSLGVFLSRRIRAAG